MLSHDNKKLNNAHARKIWAWALPSGGRTVCRWATPTCRKYCYSKRIEGYRPTVLARYRKNLRLSRRADFVDRFVAFVRGRGITLVRLHSAGEIYSAAYLAKLVAVTRRTPGTRYFLYTRAWRDPAMLPGLRALARRKNVRLWLSADRDTGVPAPAQTPRRARVAYLQAGHGEAVPPGSHLVFRVPGVRRVPATHAGGALVCPTENAVSKDAHCDGCAVCWRPLKEAGGRVSLPVLFYD